MDLLSAGNECFVAFELSCCEILVVFMFSFKSSCLACRLHIFFQPNIRVSVQIS